MEGLSIVLPAKNEAKSLEVLLPKLVRVCPEAEIIVVDDGSTDETAEVARAFGAQIVSHPYSLGNGAAIKSGARAAQGEIIVFMDADGQHDPEEIPKLLTKLQEGYRMVVGARQAGDHASFLRRWGNRFYNRLASWMVGHQVEDLTSGFRAVFARDFRRFLYLLPNGFSYPATITMAFLRSGLPVAYVPIHVRQRLGNRSHLSIWRDGIRFLIIILRIGTLYAPARLFLPISGAIFLLGLGYYLYTYLMFGRLTNMTVVLWLSALSTLLMGLLSEQISLLHYRHAEIEKDR